MPELPEVETVCRGIAPAIVGRTITKVQLWRASLREPLPRGFKKQLQAKTIQKVSRRAKYIIIELSDGHWLIHLGMSGSVTVGFQLQRKKHTHVGVWLDDGMLLHYTDPRRFGRMDITRAPLESHAWLAGIGPEPLTKNFNAKYLQTALKNKTMPIKTALMDAQLVAGVGNIYASEILFLAKVRPQTAANKIRPPRLERIVTATKAVLKKAIASGGSTLKDFVDSQGEPGYFQTQWQVYARAQCLQCNAAIINFKQSGRMTYYCPRCQK